MYHRPVCVKCQVEMRPEENGVGVVDMADFGPLQVWEADRWKCPTCGYEIITGFGQQPWAYHYEEEKFTTLLQKMEQHRTMVYCRS